MARKQKGTIELILLDTTNEYRMQKAIDSQNKKKLLTLEQKMLETRETKTCS